MFNSSCDERFKGKAQCSRKRKIHTTNQIEGYAETYRLNRGWQAPGGWSQASIGSCCIDVDAKCRLVTIWKCGSEFDGGSMGHGYIGLAKKSISFFP